MKRITILMTMLIGVFSGNTMVYAQPPTGKEIMEKVYYRPAPKDGESDMTMTLTNSRGKQRVRDIHQFFKDYNDLEKKIMFFKSPADVRNTSFMNWSYDDPSKDDDQWLYLPALMKVKRISSDSKGDKFMGSDFTYEDMTDRHPDEDTHELLRTETIDGETVYVVESIPKEDDYLYSKTITWVIKDKWVGVKKEFYDEDGDLLKVLTDKDYQKISGYWIVLEMEMHDVQDDHRTTIKLTNVKVDLGMGDHRFSERMMERGM